MAVTGASNIEGMRAVPADKLLEMAGRRGGPRFDAVIDGSFLPESPLAIFQAGKQAHVPLLAGWNSEEMNAAMVLGRDAATPENLTKSIQRLYGNFAAVVSLVFVVSFFVVVCV